MIKATELRIGNRVSFCNMLSPLNYRWEEVIILPGMIVDAHERQKMYSPIALTPEILEKMGFVDVSPDKNKMGFRRNVNSVDELCYYVQDGYLRYQTQASGFTRPLKHIQFVHQVQNCYFYLTGEELPIADCFVPRNDAATLSAATT